MDHEQHLRELAESLFGPAWEKKRIAIRWALAEIDRLRTALRNAIPWIGKNPEGPGWATPEGKLKNAMCKKVFDEATVLVDRD